MRRMNPDNRSVNGEVEPEGHVDFARPQIRLNGRFVVLKSRMRPITVTTMTDLCLPLILQPA